eukprot:8867285-Pyramimonas_sp.AAC.1
MRCSPSTARTHRPCFHVGSGLVTVHLLRPAGRVAMSTPGSTGASNMSLECSATKCCPRLGPWGRGPHCSDETGGRGDMLSWM